jgi:hypothetical protein
MARFTSVPAIPQTGIDFAQAQILDALKQNVELLTGTRNEADLSSLAVTRGALTVAVPADPTFRALTATGAGFIISGVSVPAATDYVALLRDVERLAADVASLGATLSVLIRQLRGQ